ncbi:hypothetical protein B0T24DRAFT_236517 [Lasiosphaeria ovina]|uniref:Mid2 domain-containing protein n=1 Tax=Lasiosphaeria ovina TaxID=92902 RepID=A0AAE0NAW0_9PEZI|nr:hypothetical protein B0T24DRAFT_236517 [Lasiosphaeria ovina]
MIMRMRFPRRLLLGAAATASWLVLLADASPLSTQHANATVQLPDTSPAGGVGLLRYASPDLRRRLLGSPDEHDGTLVKRACPGQLMCSGVGMPTVCCPLIDTCCTADICCKPGAACYSDGYCYTDIVITQIVTSTWWSTKYVPYTFYTTRTSTYVTVSLDYVTVTQYSKNGVATSTEWATVTKAAARRALPAPPAAMTTAPPAVDLEDLAAMTMSISPNHPGLVRRALERAGLVEKRTSIAWKTIVATVTTTWYNYYTSTYWRYVTSVSVSAATRTSIVFNGASTTTTVTSTTTVFTQPPPSPQPDPPTTQPQSPDTSPTPTPPSPVSNSPGSTPPSPTPPSSSTPPPVPVTVTFTPSYSSTPTGSNVVLTTTTSGGAAIVIFATNRPDPTGNSGSGGLPTGAVIGIGVGAAAGGLALILLLAYVLWRKHRRNSVKSDDATATTVGFNSALHAGGMSGGGAHGSVVYGAYAANAAKLDGAAASSTIVSSSTPGSPEPQPLSPHSHSQRQSWAAAGAGAGRAGTTSPVSELEERAGRMSPGLQELEERSTVRGSELDGASLAASLYEGWPGPGPGQGYYQHHEGQTQGQGQQGWTRPQELPVHYEEPTAPPHMQQQQQQQYPVQPQSPPPEVQHAYLVQQQQQQQYPVQPPPEVQQAYQVQQQQPQYPVVQPPPQQQQAYGGIPYPAHPPRAYQGPDGSWQ